jgi:hypothetical protein
MTRVEGATFISLLIDGAVIRGIVSLGFDTMTVHRGRT